jgi:voltage-dependent potassium channel beta subunit
MIMEYRRLGKSGLQLSLLSIGSWVTFQNQVDVDQAIAIMSAAYDGGMNFFDNAEAYAAGQSELIMGEVFKRTGWRRDSFVVSSKVFWGSVDKPKPNQNGLSRKHIFEACHQALQRLQVEYLDLYFCHRADPNTPVEETVRAMSDLVTQGKVLYWGTSQWAGSQIQEAIAVARQYNLVPPTMEQPEYNMFARERLEMDYARLFREYGLGTTIWSPLASGLLTGKYNNGIPEGTRMSLPGYEWLRSRLTSEEGKKSIEKVKQVTQLASDLGTNTARLALAWCAKNPNVSTVITGASRPEQVVDNLKALEVLPLLTDEVMDKIDAILGNKPKMPQFYI